jgi:hypothetical protein
MARPACLYCGAPLSAETVAAAAASAATVASFGLPPSPAAAALHGVLVVIDQSSVDARTLGQALGLGPYEMAQRRKRGGYALEALQDPATAEEQAAHLRSAGLAVFLIPESVARKEPWVAVAGSRGPDGLRLKGSSGSRLISGADLSLVVRGPIVRQYQASQDRPKTRTARLEDGYRYHLHLRASPEIVELDPGDFDFGAQGPLSGSSFLEMGNWIDAVKGEATIDDDFRYATPALGPTPAVAGGPLAAAAALSRRVSSGRGKGEGGVHDNLRQFRFYSSWRGAVERARTEAS